jgi:signal transduction histidine kinase
MVIGNPARWPGRFPVRVRLTIGYAAAFLVSVAGVLALVNGLALTSDTIPVELPATASDSLAAAQLRVSELTTRLAQLHEQQSSQLLGASLLGLAVAAVASLVVGNSMARRAITPLQDITETTRRITADSLHQRLAFNGPGDELKQLADTIDGLLARLETSFVAQRSFVANASHELRTPLTTMRAALDVAEAKGEPTPATTQTLTLRVRAELDRADQLLDGLLYLARARSGVTNDRSTHEVVSLGTFAEAALAGRSSMIAARRLDLRGVPVTGSAQVVGSTVLLARMVANLVDNAVLHGDDGGWLDVAAYDSADHVRLVVENSGPILDAETVGDLVQPFRRAGGERLAAAGSGLGLSIVEAIVEAHGGTTLLTAREDGGLRADITLPAAPEGIVS